MTRKEFEKLRLSIEAEKFCEDCGDPMTYGSRRAAFEQEKFKRLIAAAKNVPMQTARTKLAQWKRQLMRANRSQARFDRLRDDINGVNARAVRAPAASSGSISAAA